MKWRILWCGICMSVLCLCTYGQSMDVTTVKYDSIKKTSSDRVVNFGIKGGFTSSLFLVSQFRLNGHSVTEVQNNYKIGYLAAVFMRINFQRHFLQPELSYNINWCNIEFAKPQTGDNSDALITAQSSITSSIHSIDIPVIYGYNIIKQGPYSMAIFGGPKIRYIWRKKSKVIFENFDQENIKEVLRPLNLSLTVGVSVTISPIFFDFRYDIGLHNISKRIDYDESTSSTTENTSEIHFHRQDNVLSFSLGFFF